MSDPWRTSRGTDQPDPGTMLASAMHQQGRWQSCPPRGPAMGRIQGTGLDPHRDAVDTRASPGDVGPASDAGGIGAIDRIPEDPWHVPAGESVLPEERDTAHDVGVPRAEVEHGEIGSIRLGLGEIEVGGVQCQGKGVATRWTFDAGCLRIEDQESCLLPWRPAIGLRRGGVGSDPRRWERPDLDAAPIAQVGDPCLGRGVCSAPRP